MKRTASETRERNYGEMSRGTHLNAADRNPGSHPAFAASAAKRRGVHFAEKKGSHFQQRWPRPLYKVLPVSRPLFRFTSRISRSLASWEKGDRMDGGREFLPVENSRRVVSTLCFSTMNAFRVGIIIYARRSRFTTTSCFKVDRCFIFFFFFFFYHVAQEKPEATLCCNKFDSHCLNTEYFTRKVNCCWH